MRHFKALLPFIVIFLTCSALFAQKGLIKLIEEKDLEKIKEKVEQGKYDVNLPVDRHYPILVAINSGDVAIVKYLLEKGADLNLKPEGYGIGPDQALRIALEREEYEIAKLLSKYEDSETNGRALVYVAKHPTEAQKAFSAYINNMAENPQLFDVNNEKKEIWDDTLLSVRNLERVYPLATEFLKAGAALKIENEYADLPLQAALKNSNLGLVVYLVKKGADVNYTNGEYNMLPAVAASANPHLLRYFLANGADSINYNYCVDSYYRKVNSGDYMSALKQESFLLDLFKDGYKDREGYLYKQCLKLFDNIYDVNLRKDFLGLMYNALKATPESLYNTNGIDPVFELLYRITDASDPEKNEILTESLKKVLTLNIGIKDIYRGYDNHFACSPQELFNVSGVNQYSWTDDDYLKGKVNVNGFWFVTPIEYAIHRHSFDMVQLLMDYEYDTSPESRIRMRSIAKYNAEKFPENTDAQEILALVKEKIPESE